jgi:hypothetical protein
MGAGRGNFPQRGLADCRAWLMLRNAHCPKLPIRIHQAEHESPGHRALLLQVRAFTLALYVLPTRQPI